MPRPRKPDGREPKSRSRNGCWSCKARKVKCTEERPSCSKCIKGGYQCDYGIRLNWDGRRSKRPQLKAVHLDNETLIDGDDGNFNDFIGDGDDDSGAGLSEAQPHPPRSQSQHEMQFQLDFTLSPPSTSSSSSAPNASVDGFNLISFQAPATSAMAAPTRPSKPSTSQGSTAGQFQVFGATTMTPPSPVLTKQIKNGAKPQLGAPPASSGASSAPRSSIDTQRTPLPGSTSHPPSSQPYLSGSIDESVSSVDAADHRRTSLKRRRIDSDVSENDFAWTWPLSPSTGSGSLSAASPRQAVYPPNHAPNRPIADASSPRPADENLGRSSPHANGNLIHLQTTNDFRRLSVSSLLSGPFDPNAVVDTPPENPPSATQDDARAEPESQDHSRHHRGHHQYGTDAGFVDLDLSKNDDFNALSGTPGNSRFGKTSCYKPGKAHEPAGYYAKPVPVHIPRALGNLPSKLMDNPMNLLYFHHFINNTARVLVPHDDPQSNPFRTILPQLALNNDNLMSLLLAYSASHRARVLDQPEPAMRIALWVQDIFPALRESLTDPKQKISNANVATAIMLSSLAIVSPTAFGYDIPWQRHLMLARELIASRPEGLRVDHHSSLEGQVCSFLWSWFAYLDVLGGLSGGLNDVSPAWILDYKVYDPQDDDEIDCIMGFTTRCIYILSQIAELVRECEPSRLEIMKRDPSGWIPGADVERRVQSLEVDVRDSMVQKPRPCSHLLHKGDVTCWDTVEMTATNEAYHWAALVHLHRRVLGKLPDHPDVHGPVQEIIKCLDKVKVGGTAENCWLFPLFTAACECYDDAQRKKMLVRIRQIEGCGMMQVTRARALMQKSWGMSKPWEVILEGEFLG